MPRLWARPASRLDPPYPRGATRRHPRERDGPFKEEASWKKGNFQQAVRRYFKEKMEMNLVPFAEIPVSKSICGKSTSKPFLDKGQQTTAQLAWVHLIISLVDGCALPMTERNAATLAILTRLESLNCLNGVCIFWAETTLFIIRKMKFIYFARTLYGLKHCWKQLSLLGSIFEHSQFIRLCRAVDPRSKCSTCPRNGLL